MKYIAHSGIGCNVGGAFYNVLAYADDILLLTKIARYFLVTYS